MKRHLLLIDNLQVAFLYWQTQCYYNSYIAIQTLCLELPPNAAADVNNKYSKASDSEAPKL